MPSLPAIAAIALLAAPGSAAAATSGAGSVDRGVTYARAGDTALRMDIHRPAVRPAAGAPAVVWIHGGGFHSGTRARVEPYARFFARRGYVAAAIDYRLLPRSEIRDLGWDAGARVAQRDAEAAVAHLRRNARRLGVDASRIAVGGISAGAITALRVAARATGVSAVQAAVGISGFGPEADLDGGDPPLLLVHGAADRTIPLRRAQRTCRAARDAGGRCDLVSLPGADHGVGRRRVRLIAGRAAGWLQRQLGLPAR